jgi:hypothetical protein
MSDTSEFASAPEEFLKNKVIMVPEELDKAVTEKPGIYRFKIEPVSRNLYSLELDVKKSDDNINAYYLPWKTKEATTMDLGSEADFFFTSEMTNCRFTVLMGTTGTPKVAHIAGTLEKSERNTKEKEVFGDRKRVRRLSISGAVGAGAHSYRGQDNSEVDLRSSAFVFGVRKSDAWKFYAQIAKGVMSCKLTLTDDLSVLGYVDILNLKKTDKESGKS